MWGTTILTLMLILLMFRSVEASLKAVVMLTRHGDRSPIKTYPKDPYKDYKWPGGFAALSPVGAKQIATSGKNKAKRYASLLKRLDHEFKNLLVESSSIQRCVDSAKYFLDTFLPHKYPKNLIRVQEFKKDTYLAPIGQPCPRYEDDMKKLYRLDNPEVQQILKSIPGSEDAINEIAENTGWKIDSLTLIAALDDILLIEKLNGLEMPHWVDSLYDSFIRPLSQAKSDISAASKVRQIRSSVLLKVILDKLKKAAQGSNPNICLFSTHDSVLNGISYRMNIINQTSRKPKYGAVLAIELHENAQLPNDSEVKIFYFKDYSDKYPIQVNIPDCKAPCAFKKFEIQMQSKVVTNYEAKCAKRMLRANIPDHLGHAIAAATILSSASFVMTLTWRLFD